ncbi:MAG: T9SS type A sorting domain-containing protein [Bacteroidia bacterium]
MKTIQPFLKKYFPVITALSIFFLSLAAISIAQSKDEGNMKVKIVKIVDGDTTTIEKTMDEASVKDFTKQFQNLKGKNVQVMITVEGTGNDKKKNKSSSSMNFNFNMDSSSAGSFAKAFVFSDSAMKKNFVWNDSMLKNLPKNFDFNFDFNDEGKMNDFDFNINTDEDGKTVIIKDKGGKTVVINGDEDEEDGNVSISQSESSSGKTQTKTIVINGDKSANKKKVIVTTSVTVVDMDDDGNKRKRSDKEENNFNFYPNPSDGNFTLELNLNGKDDASVHITDINGKEVYNEKISGNGKTSKTINLGSDKKGTFIVIIKQGKKTTSKKIIIE